MTRREGQSVVFHSEDELGSTVGVSCDMCHPDAALEPDDPKMRALEAYIIAQRKGTSLDYGKH